MDTNLGLQAKGDHGLPTLDGDADNIKVPVVDFLDTAEDDDDAAEIQNEPVLEAIKRLILEAKKYKSFTSLFYLNMLVQFVELWTKYQQNPRIKGPMCRASHAIAISISKGPYMARKIHSLYSYVERFRALPPISKGKHHAYPTLLNNERIAAAVRRYLTVLADGEVSVLGKKITGYLPRLTDNTTPIDETG